MRCYFCTLVLLFCVTLPCQAQGDKAKPNTLTPKEIADGWILLFDGETTFGWTGNAVSQPKIVDGALIPVIPKGTCIISAVNAHDDFELRFDYKRAMGGPKISAGVGVLGSTGSRKFQLLNNAMDWTTVSISSSNKELLIEGPGFRSRWSQSPATTGKIAFMQDPDGENLILRNIKFRPLNTTSLFNGKDLTGWKEFPGKKSKFAVIDNAINVKDGPGDLQTVGKYKDFILQLECISNGKHLNSGIFFRCRDNEYQNGYEAQIHNGFLEMPKKYRVEEYDPKTNKLVGKKEMMFNAIDFGTGAIYRRVPARKQMSKDGEWFGMTIVAHGNHFATWVNGVQVTDWTDNRPKSDNARTGCKLEAGHISIQGHDPTTDLSFKNFRIAEFK